MKKDNNGDERPSVGENKLLKQPVDLFVSQSCSQVDVFEAHGFPPLETHIEWISDTRMFRVRYKTRHTNGNLHVVHQIIPMEIAERSHCDCGGLLALGDYTVTTMQDELVFTAIYYCPSCKKTVQHQQEDIATIIKRYLRSLKSLKIGPIGLEVTEVKKGQRDA
jgi:hypothetical protein